MSNEYKNGVRSFDNSMGDITKLSRPNLENILRKQWGKIGRQYWWVDCILACLNAAILILTSKVESRFGIPESAMEVVFYGLIGLLILIPIIRLVVSLCSHMSVEKLANEIMGNEVPRSQRKSKRSVEHKNEQ